MIAIAPPLMVKTIINGHTLLHNTWSKIIIGLPRTLCVPDSKNKNYINNH